MSERDLDGVDALATAALGEDAPGLPESDRLARSRARLERILHTDPGGCWTSVDGDGRVVGVALAIRREGLWGLSLFAVAEGLRGAGLGRRLLEPVLAYGEGARGAIILSSPDPRAMRRYARAGFALRPCVAAAGIVDRARVDVVGVDEPNRARGLAVAADVSRFVRGAAHGEDLVVYLDHGGRLLCLDDRGFVVHREGSVLLLAARDAEAASALLRAALAQGPPGGTQHVEFLAAGHDWAVDVCLTAGRALSPDGPIFTRGDVGPMAPYLPSGAFL